MVGSGNPAATHCSMPFMSLSRVRISGFAAGREKWPYVRLLENLTKAHSTISESSITFSRPKGTLRACCSKGRIWTSEWKAQGRQMWGSDQKRLSRLELPSPHVDCPSYGCRGLRDLPVPGMAEVAGPPGRVSVSSEGGTWKTASDQDSRIPNYLKGGNPV